jgi:hypothetical protein
MPRVTLVGKGIFGRRADLSRPRHAADEGHGRRAATLALAHMVMAAGSACACAC